jgi:hypothetical protein
MSLLNDDEKKNLLLMAKERWEKDPEDTELVKLFGGVMICDSLEELGIVA